MNRIHTSAFLITALFLSSCAHLDSGISTTEYAVMSAEPYKWEVQRAYGRFWDFLTHLNPKEQGLLKETPYVAVISRYMTADEVPGLTYRLGQGRAQAVALYSSDPIHPGSQWVMFIIVFDTRTRRPATADGVFIVDSPQRGTIGMFGGIHAIYAGSG